MLGKKASGKAKLTVAILEGKTWHPPVSFDVPKQVGQFSAWRCGAGWGGYSWLEQEGNKLTVTELVCKKDGCKTRNVSWTQGDLKNVLLLGYVQEEVLLIYEGVAGDTRTRTAKLDELPKAASKLAFENEEFGGVNVGGKPRLLQGDRTYLVLQNEELRVYGFEGNGKQGPVAP
jgi:hypothetical protein